MKTVRIGRNSNNDIVFNDPTVTRVAHCIITLDDNGVYRVIDNSTNGTYINGNRIGRGTETIIRPMDVLRVGRVTVPWETYFRDYQPSSPRQGGATHTVAQQDPGMMPGMMAGGVTFGRVAGNNVVINDPTVSSRHMVIYRQGAYYMIQDLGSKNGTFVNGQRIYGQTPLNPGDIVKIGNSLVRWQDYFVGGAVTPGGTQADSSDSKGWSHLDDDEEEGASKPQTAAALQIIAFVVSLIGLGCLLYAIVPVSEMGLLFGYASFWYSMGWITVGVNVLALILGGIAEMIEESDDTKYATWACSLSGACLVIMLVIYIYFQATYGGMGGPRMLSNMVESIDSMLNGIF